LSRLTEKAISAARAGKAEVFLWDGEMPGFGCRIKPSGVKTFLLQYRVGNRTRRYKIGRWPVMKVEQARIKARRELAGIDDGADPAEEKRRARKMAGDTVEAVAQQHIAEYAKPDAKKKRQGLRSWRERERIFKTYVNPILGKRPIHQVSRREVIDLLDDVGRNNGRVMANRTFGAIRAVFNWALSKDIIGASPVAGIKRPGEERRGARILTDSEIREVWQAGGSLGYPFGHLVRLLLATGQRRGEVAGMSRSGEIETDDDGAVWTIPGVRTKNKLPHEVPLAPLAFELIEKAASAREEAVRKAVADRGDVPVAVDAEELFLFTTTGDRPVSGFSRAKRRLDRAILDARRKAAREKSLDPRKIEAMPDWDVHDLRRTMRTRLSKLGVDPEIAERVINHVPGGLRATYDLHRFRAEKREALDRWARALAAIVRPVAEDNVRELRPGRRDAAVHHNAAPLAAESAPQ
jgi:integrase